MARYVAFGAGRMGRGIAIAFAYAGHSIALVDSRVRDAAAAERLRAEAFAEIRQSLAILADLGARKRARSSASPRACTGSARDAPGARRRERCRRVPETLAAKGDALAASAVTAAPSPSSPRDEQPPSPSSRR